LNCVKHEQLDSLAPEKHAETGPISKSNGFNMPRPLQLNETSPFAVKAAPGASASG